MILKPPTPKIKMISKYEYTQRRINLMNKISTPNPIAIVHGMKPHLRMPNVYDTYHQFSNMIYLSGYDQPGGILTIERKSSSIKSTLFLPNQKSIFSPNSKFPIFPKIDIQKIISKSGVDSVLPQSEFKSWLTKQLSKNSNIYSSFPYQQSISYSHKKLDPYLDSLRVIKSPAELKLISKAREISIEAHKKALSSSVLIPGHKELYVAANFKRICYNLGATGLAYPIVCSSGTNSTCLHNIENKSVMKEGTTLMMDAGCEYHHYASDITTTVPIGNPSKLSQQKKDILEMVEDTKNTLVSLCKTGQINSLAFLHYKSEKMLLLGLEECGVNIEPQNLIDVYPHNISHFIGLDVHDADSIQMSFPLQKGCVFACEPGVYFQKDNKFVPDELKGFGCRFEDTVILN